MAENKKIHTFIHTNVRSADNLHCCEESSTYDGT